jgi:nicotinate-nucleotide adenylyltransferase
MDQTLVLLGGTFDPIHHGHLIVARCLAERCEARVTLVPASTPPHKPPAGASPADRLEMVRLAIEGEEAFDICDDELRRPGPSYTYRTLRGLRERLGPEVRLRWVIGADMLEDLPSWRNVSEVLEMADLLVAMRPPWQDRIESIFSELSAKFTAETLTRLRAGVTETPLVDLSSSEVRRRVAQGRSIRYFVPEAVEAFIARKGLYQKEQGQVGS